MMVVYVLKNLAKNLKALAIIALALMIVGTVMAFLTPTDARQGGVFRMLYIHVPLAWFALWNYAFLCVVSILFLWRRLPIWDHLSIAIARTGMLMTFLALITGSLWGRATWGAWWVWDGRLTSTLILLLLYVGYCGLRGAFPSRNSYPAALFVLVGAVDLPIIILSAEWWSTLHQPSSIIRPGGPAIAWSMLWPLVLMSVAFAMVNMTWIVTIWKTQSLKMHTCLHVREKRKS